MTEFEDVWFRSEVGAGGALLSTGVMLIFSSKSLNEISVDRVWSIRGASDEAVCRMKRTMTLRIYFTQESSNEDGSCHDGVVEYSDGACRLPFLCALDGRGESGDDGRSSVVRA